LGADPIPARRQVHDVAEPQPTEPKRDPYDYGDTGLSLPVRQEPAATPAPPAPAPSSEKPPAEQPRRPDGTFLPRTAAHPDWLVAAAQEAGIGDDELAAMSSEMVSRAVIRHQRQRAEFQSEMATARTIQNNDRFVPQQPAPKEPEDDLGISAEIAKELDPSLLAFFKRQAAENKALKEKLGQVEKTAQAVVQSKHDSEVDQSFEALPTEFKPLVGDGPLQDIADEEQKRVRLAIYREASTIQQGSWKARIKMAAQILYGKAAKALAKPAEPASQYQAAAAETPPAPKPAEPKNGKYTQEEWDAAGLQKPTQRKVEELPPGPERAKQNLRRKLADLEPTDQEVLDGFLP
jgi:hypothetical protein